MSVHARVMLNQRVVLISRHYIEKYRSRYEQPRGAVPSVTSSVVEHVIEESFDGSVAVVRCRKCGSKSTVRRLPSTSLEAAEQLDLPRAAWDYFLRKNPWDCAKALVKNMMKR